jgi:hypothetical protein
MKEGKLLLIVILALGLLLLFCVGCGHEIELEELNALEGIGI